MGFFNLNSILYNLRKICKYLSFSLMIVAFVVIALLLMGKGVNASTTVLSYTFNENGQELVWNIDSSGIVTVSGTLWGANVNGNFSTLVNSELLDYWDNEYSYYPYVRENYSRIYYGYFKVPRGESFYCVRTGSHNEFAAYSGSGSFFWYDSYYKDSSYKNNGFTISNYTCYPLCNLYSDSSLTSTMFTFVDPSSVESFKAPSLLNYDDTENWGNSLYTGEFTYFFIDSYTDKPIRVYMYDQTDMSVDSNYNLNGVYSWSITLPDVDDNGNSLYLYDTNDGQYKYAIPCTVPFGSYRDKRDYHLVIEYQDDADRWDSVHYYWTTDFTQAGTTKQEENKEDKMLSGINSLYQSQRELNNFLSGTNYNSDDIKLPEIEINFEQEHFLDEIFSKIRNTFVNDSYVDVEIPVPFSENTITIPSNYIEEHIPAILINLIRLFYWFIIGRYIFKDVFGYVDSLRQGDFFMQSEKDIKTEVL